MDMLENCPFCHHQDAVLLRFEASQRGGRRGIFRCAECGTLYPRPRMASNEAADHNRCVSTNTDSAQFENPRRAEPPAAGFRAFLQSWTAREWLTDFVQRRVGTTGAVLDVGASSGRACFLLEKLGYEAWGLEPQENAAYYGRNMGLKVLAGSFPDGVPSELSGRRFRLVTVLETVYYFVDLRQALGRLRNMLEPGGYLLIKAAQGESPLFQEPGASYLLRYGDYVQGIPTLASLHFCLEKTGFTVEVGEAYCPAGGRIGRIQALLRDPRRADRVVVLARPR